MEHIELQQLLRHFRISKQMFILPANGVRKEKLNRKKNHSKLLSLSHSKFKDKAALYHQYIISFSLMTSMKVYSNYPIVS